jgi:hypothetical protein
MILTIDNFRKLHVVVVDRCCMCKKSGYSLDHILLHCKKASALLNTIFILVELVWVMRLCLWCGRLFCLLKSILEGFETPLCGRWFCLTLCFSKLHLFIKNNFKHERTKAKVFIVG